MNLTFLFGCSNIRMMDTEILLLEYTEFPSGIKWITTWDYGLHTQTPSLWLFHLCCYSLVHVNSSSLILISLSVQIFSWLTLDSFSGVTSISVYTIFLFVIHSLSFVFYMYFSYIADYFNRMLNSIQEWVIVVPLRHCWL